MFLFSRFEYQMFYVLYIFMTYLLTLPHISYFTGNLAVTVKPGFDGSSFKLNLA
jgi:hypothetical protein